MTQAAQNRFGTIAPLTEEMLCPRRIAIFGASPNVSQFNGKVVQALRAWNFPGEVFPINPKYREVLGFQSYAALDQVPGEIDACIVAIGRNDALEALEQAAARGARLGVIVSAGFGEADDAGRAMQQRLQLLPAQNGIRLVGPNCLGYINVAEGIPLTAAAVPQFERIREGCVGLVSQSAGLGLASILYHGLRRGLGFSHVLSSGNEADIGLAEFVEFLVDDHRTQIVLAVIEQIRDYPRFCRAALRAARVGKPIIVLKVGRSEVGARMANSHTGSLTGSDLVQEGMFRQLGVVRVYDFPELCELAAVLQQKKIHGAAPRPRVLALSGSGGLGTFFADLASHQGIEMPPLTDVEKGALKEAVDNPSTVQNPIDLSGLAAGNHERYANALRVGAAFEHYDVVVPIISAAQSYAPLLKSFVEVASASARSVCLVWAGGDYANSERVLEQSGRLPWFHSPESCLRAIKGAHAWHRLQKQLQQPELMALRERLAGTFPANRDQKLVCERVLSERESTALLASAGLPVMRMELVRSADEAVAVANEIGFPVALKIEAEGLVHKAQAGGVLLGLANENAVRAAFERLAALPVAGFRGALVQEMAKSGLELIIGVKNDPLLGMAMVVGLGGIHAELFADVVSSKLPLCEVDIMDMLASLRVGPRLLDGEFDIPAFVNVALAVQSFALTMGDRLSQLDLNPVIVMARSSGCCVVDANVVLLVSA